VQTDSNKAEKSPWIVLTNLSFSFWTKFNLARYVTFCWCCCCRTPSQVKYCLFSIFDSSRFWFIDKPEATLDWTIQPESKGEKKPSYKAIEFHSIYPPTTISRCWMDDCIRHVSRFKVKMNSWTFLIGFVNVNEFSSAAKRWPFRWRGTRESHHRSYRITSIQLRNKYSGDECRCEIDCYSVSIGVTSKCRSRVFYSCRVETKRSAFHWTQDKHLSGPSISACIE
jgi:hypothetical protein